MLVGLDRTHTQAHTRKTTALGILGRVVVTSVLPPGSKVLT